MHKNVLFYESQCTYQAAHYYMYTGFLSNQPLGLADFCRLSLVISSYCKLGQVVIKQTSEDADIYVAGSYMPDTLPVAQPKHTYTTILRPLCKSTC